MRTLDIRPYAPLSHSARPLVSVLPSASFSGCRLVPSALWLGSSLSTS